jgi:hypothetical protein
LSRCAPCQHSSRARLRTYGFLGPAASADSGEPLSVIVSLRPDLHVTTY